jgi:hypothetical protein
MIFMTGRADFANLIGWLWEIVKHNELIKGFVLLPIFILIPVSENRRDIA